MKATDWKTRPRRAIALLSGGLDSTLAIRLMIEQGVDVLAVNFVSPCRHFRLHEKLKAVLGRNQIENERLSQIANHQPRMELANRPGPLMLTRGEVRDGDREKLGRLLRSFASKVTDREVLVKFSGSDRAEELLIQGMATSQELEGWRI